MIRTAHAMFIAGSALLLGATGALAPEQAYRAQIAEQNKGYATVPHAMLKIQDSVYLDDGQSAVLSGRSGDPASWHWQPRGGGPVRITLTHGTLQVLNHGKPVAPEAVARGIVVDPGIDVTGQPTQVSAGVQGWRFFVYNQRRAEALEFAGVAYFPFDAGFIVQATFVAETPLAPHDFPTSRGTTKQFFRAGEARFTLQGRDMSLPLYADSRDPRQLTSLSAFFTDELTGKGAYGSGRYVEAALEGFPPRTLTLDFNQAYNPNCARSPHFTCPIASDHIPVAISAGERDPHAP